MIIKGVKARKILNSRGQETIEVIADSDILQGIGSAPSGASKSSKEVKDFPKGADGAVEFVNNNLSKDLADFSFEKFEDFKKIEKIINKYDKTKNLSVVGGNLIVALEFAILNCFKQPWKFLNPEAKQLPRPLGNVIGGGAHVKEGIDYQEFLLLSLNAPSIKKAIEANADIHKSARGKLGFFFNKKTDEGAWAPNDLNESEILDILSEQTRKISKEKNFDVKIGIDVAANTLFNGNYKYKHKELTREEHIEYVIDLAERYNIIYLEDPVEENDAKGFKEITNRLKHRCLVCGDDFISTNVSLLKKYKDCLNAVIVKPNQIGSLIKTKEIIDFALKNKITPVISHRSGETMDSTIVHLAAGFNVPIIKCGISGKEREIKLATLERIENEIKVK